MKKIIMIGAFALISVSAVFAQTTANVKRAQKMKYTPEQRAEKATKELDKRAMLSEDQKTKVYQIELEKFNKNKALMATNSDGAQAKAQFKETNRKARKDLSNVLNQDQKTKVKNWRMAKKNKKLGAKKHKSGNSNAPLISAPATQN